MTFFDTLLDMSFFKNEGGISLSMFDTIKQYGWLLLIGIGAVILFFLLPSERPDPNVVVLSEEVDELQEKQLENDPTTVIVDIKGEVQQPGIYEIDADSRIHDVIILAGGFTDEADPFQVNLAQKVQDEMAIIVPKQGDESLSHGQASGKVSINVATLEDIQTLHGIGPAKAQAIIQYREEHGLFKSVEDLLNVPGIGKKTLENIQEQIQIP